MLLLTDTGSTILEKDHGEIVAETIHRSRQDAKLSSYPSYDNRISSEISQGPFQACLKESAEASLGQHYIARLSFQFVRYL